MSELHIEAIPVGAFEANCYLLYNENGEAMVIDPGADVDRIAERIQALGLTVVAYPTTHGHMDHVGGLAELAERYPAPIGLHPEDARWAFSPTNCWEPYYPPPRAPENIDRNWAEGQTWTDAGFTYEILFTPGHSPGGVCFLFKEHGVLISGDTLFKQSKGRDDLPGADPAALDASLARLAALEGDYRVFPGHGPDTTLEHERRFNPFL